MEMYRCVFLLVSCAAVHGMPKTQTKIVGGWETAIRFYPQVASLLYSNTGTNHRQSCGGTILNTRSILTAAHCVVDDPAARWKIRAGSTYANSGGTVYSVSSIKVHNGYVRTTFDNDVAILRSATRINHSSLVKPGTIAGASYYLGDNQAVWAVGWGNTNTDGPASETLRHVQIWSVNQSTCKSRYSGLGRSITDNMLCSGWLDVGGRDQCQGDSGGPLFHNGVVVGVCSWGRACGIPTYPGVNARVSKFTSWIQDNA